MNEGELARSGIVCVLGPVGVMTPDGTHRPVSGQQGLVLALLASAHPHPVAVDVLADELWPSKPPKSATTGLRVVVNRLRDRLAPIRSGNDPIQYRDGYLLALGAGQLDHLVFTRAIEDAGNGRLRTNEVVDALTDALTLWRGRAFEPFDDSPRLSTAAGQLGTLRCDAEERLVQALLDAGRHDRAAVLATSLVESEPYRERRWQQLMVALYQSGRQAEALQAANRVRAVLAEDLGIDPGPELTRLELAILNHDPSLRRPRRGDLGGVSVDEFTALLRHPPSRVPTTATSYITAEDQDLEPRLPSTPMLTITGPPGVGKSRLAARLVTGTTEIEPADRPVRVVWLDLVDTAFDGRPAAAIRDALAGALDLRPTTEPLEEAVAELVRDTTTVVVFDNADHLGDVVAQLAEQLLANCPDLRVVVTSRVPLASRSEKVHAVAPLPTRSAVDLLIERAPSGIEHHWDRSDLGALAEQVDRIPLAIELIAPHLVTTTPPELTKRLARTLDPASGRGRLDPRHQSMASAIDWSVNLLDEGDRKLLALVGAMAGHFTTAQLTAVLTRDITDSKATAGGENGQSQRHDDTESVEQSLHRLTEHCLIRSSGLGPRKRWTMTNTTRTYVRSGSRLAKQRNRWARHHGFVHLDLARQLGAELTGEREERAVSELRRLAPQISAAHRWFIGHGEAAASAALSMAMWEYTFFRQDYSRYRWLGDCLELEGIAQLDDYAELLGLAALAAWARDRLVTSRHLADRAETQAAERGQPIPLAALKARFNVAVHDDRLSEAASWLNRLLAESAERGDRRHHADNLVVATLGLSQVGSGKEARQMAEEAEHLANSTGNPTTVAWARVAVAAAAVERHPERAARSYAAAARLARTVHNRWVSGMAGTGLVTALRRQGRRDQSRQLLIEITQLWARARQQGLISRAAQEAVLLLGDSEASAEELDRAADLITSLEQTGYRLQLLPDDQAVFDELANTLAGRATAGDRNPPGSGLPRAVVNALS